MFNEIKVSILRGTMTEGDLWEVLFFTREKGETSEELKKRAGEGIAEFLGVTSLEETITVEINFNYV